MPEHRGHSARIHRDLNPAAPAMVPMSRPNPAWGTPDEQIPAAVQPGQP